MERLVYEECDSTCKSTREFYPRAWPCATLFMKRCAPRLSPLATRNGWPFIESIDLYAAKSGEELVKKQSFVFEDRGGDLVTLRPELTPSLARMIAAKQGELNFPLRWWSFGPFWRYEQPQKGRAREFFQWNVDMLVSIHPKRMPNWSRWPRPSCARWNESSAAPFSSMTAAWWIPSLTRLALNRLGVWISPPDRPSFQDETGCLGCVCLELGLAQKQLEALKDTLNNFDLWRKNESLVRLFSALEALGVRNMSSLTPISCAVFCITPERSSRLMKPAAPWSAPSSAAALW